MTEATQEQVTEAPIGAVEGRPGVTVVTQENFNAYVDQKLGIKPAEENPNVDPEVAAAEELKQIEAKKAETAVQPKEGDVEGSKVFFKGKWVQKHDFNYRLHLKTEEARAELKSEIEAKAAEAKKAKEDAEKAARERDELKAKYEPPPSLDPGPEPDETKYTDMAKFKADLKEWSARNARAEDAKKQAEQQAKDAAAAAQKRWTDSEAALIKEMPDYAERLANAPGANIGVSNELKDAIIESEIGPKLRLHLAENPEVLQGLLKMTVGRMLKEVGKIEVALAKEGPKAEAKPQTLAGMVAEISKAPAPITPISGGNSAPGTGNIVDEQGNVLPGQYEAYKAARKAGKIK